MPVYLYRSHLGRLLGNRLLLLTHIGHTLGLGGRRLWKSWSTEVDGPEAVLMRGFGRDSDWLRNIEANHNEEIMIGFRHFVASRRFLSNRKPTPAARLSTAIVRRQRVYDSLNRT